MVVPVGSVGSNNGRHIHRVEGEDVLAGLFNHGVNLILRDLELLVNLNMGLAIFALEGNVGTNPLALVSVLQNECGVVNLGGQFQDILGIGNLLERKFAPVGGGALAMVVPVGTDSLLDDGSHIHRIEGKDIVAGFGNHAIHLVLGNLEFLVKLYYILAVVALQGSIGANPLGSIAILHYEAGIGYLGGKL